MRTKGQCEEHANGLEQQVVSREEEQRTAHPIHKGWECFRRELQQREFFDRQSLSQRSKCRVNSVNSSSIDACETETRENN